MRIGLILTEALVGLRRNISMVISVVLVTFVSLTFVGAAILMQGQIGVMRGYWAERAQVAAELPADLLALYEKIRATEGGVGAGAIARGACGGCRLDLMGNEKAEIRAAPSDEVLRHEECTRIMVRTAESGI